MRENWWYRWGLPTHMLITILCFTHYAFAAPLTTHTSAKKRKPETTAVKSPKSQAKVGKQPQPEVQKKRAQTTASIFFSTKSKKTTASSSKLRASASRREAPSFAKSRKFPPPKLRASASRRETPSSAQPRKSAKIRVLALKETKDHKYVKMVVTVPAPASRTTSARTTRRSSSPKPQQKNLPSPLRSIVPAPALFTSQKSPTVTETTQQRPAPPPPLLAEPLPPTPPPAAPPTPVAPAPESPASSETTLAALKQPETSSEPKLERHQSSVGYVAGRSAFHVKFNGERLLHRLNSVFVLPGDEIFVEVVDTQKKRDYTFRTTLGPERQLGPTRWYWNAPSSPGIYSVKIQRAHSNTAVALNVFVMVPLDRVEDGTLNGYRIGHYPTVALRQQAIYTPPRGLIEVTADNENTLVSPHFRLRQFLCKQDGSYPKYMILDTRLLNALELLLEKANAHGYPTRTLTVMSGYRTPYYNRAIGNSTRYSRHVWGDAADIFIDENPQDGRMDDLNQDGEVDSHDAEVLYDLIESEYDSRFQKLHVGGLARYRETSSHGPFVHVDVRGVEARWGAGSVAKGTTPSTLPVALRDNRLSSQPSYWRGERATESAP